MENLEINPDGQLIFDKSAKIIDGLIIVFTKTGV